MQSSDAIAPACSKSASDGVWPRSSPSARVRSIVVRPTALSAVGLTTIDVTRAEALLRGQTPSDELFEQAGAIASEDCMPIPDGRGPVDYKRHVAGVLTKRALRKAAARALS